MILKYKNQDVWGYLDGITQVACKEFNTAQAIFNYNKEVEEGKREDTEKDYPVDIRVINKAFTMATEIITEEMDTETGNSHTENLLVDIPPHDMEGHMPAYIILAYLQDNNDYKTVYLITNQPVYLLNDNGKTIERLS